MKKISVIGQGYVGLPVAVEFGKCRSTVGFDIDSERIKELKSGFDRTKECTKAQLESSTNLIFSSNLADISDSQIYVVAIPTPVDKNNNPDLAPLKNVSEMLSGVIKKGDIIIYESTVYPGATEEVCVPILELGSNLTFNKEFFCGYSPERVNPGDKERTLTKIVKITSGSNPEVAHEIDKLYSEIITAGTFPVSNMMVAEAAKVIENTQRDLNIAFVNELSVIFERLGIDTEEVLKAAETKWNFLPFKPGMVGGHCIGVDPYYLTFKAQQVGYNPQVILSGRRINDNMSRYAARTFIKYMSQNNINISSSRIGVLGVSFKEDCPDIRNSKVFDLIYELESWNINVDIIDPVVDHSEVLNVHGKQIQSIENISNLDSIIVAVGHNSFRKLSPSELKSLCVNENPVIADLKSIYVKSELESAGFKVFRL
tara:strand:- start:189 stop:1472 length:1284 start_codon:yes stop_codon:yes gene_type:complete